MRSPRRVLLEQVRALCPTAGDRFAELGARVDVYRRGADGEPEFARRLPWVFGGRYDRLVGTYVAAPDPDAIHVLKVHEGQVQFLELMWDDSIRYVMGLGAPGGGKSLNIITAAGLYGIAEPHRLIGMPAATWGGAEVVWKKFVSLYEPLGWIADMRPGAMEIEFTNGSLYQFVGMTKQSGSSNSAAQGKDWHIAFPDEFQGMTDDAEREIDARGRINKNYKIMSSATNSPEHFFQERLRAYRDNPLGRVVRFTGPDNCFTPLEQWERMRAKWSAEDYNRIINCEDVPQNGRVFPTFLRAESIRALPAEPHIGSLDITNRITLERYQRPYDYVVGVDFGSLESAAVILKAYQGRGRDEREWYAVGEIIVADKTTDFFAQELLKFFGRDPGRFLCIADPHEYKEVDRSDFTLFKKAGINVVRASGGRIPQKHRLSVVNTLLLAADGKRRLFVGKGFHLDKLVEGLGNLMYDALGNVKRPKADRHHMGTDLSHAPDALSFGVFPFERHRGTFSDPPPRQAHGRIAHTGRG